MNNHPLMETHLEQFAKSTRRSRGRTESLECKLTGKKFNNEDSLEFHLKTGPFRGEKLQDSYQF